LAFILRILAEKSRLIKIQRLDGMVQTTHLPVANEEACIEVISQLETKSAQRKPRKREREK
jgi:uncharacterized coiled-coil DUF342 family protein